MPNHEPVALIQTLAQYVSHVEENCAADNVLFRGQPVDEPLLPKIARLQTKAEVTATEKRMLADWKMQALPFIESQPESDWDWLALAQHFGMATRLLDWTVNPFAALWFAVQNPPAEGTVGTIWYFEVADDDYLDPKSQSDPLAIDRTRVFRPRHLTRRIIAQSGWFTAHRYLDDGPRSYVALEGNRSFRDRLRKLIVPPTAFSDLRRELDRFGVNAASLYGGPDGVCRHIEWLHTYLTDEVPAER